MNEATRASGTSGTLHPCPDPGTSGSAKGVTADSMQDVRSGLLANNFVGLERLRTVENIHNGVAKADCITLVKFIGPIVKVEKEVHEVGANAKMFFVGVGVAHSRQLARHEAEEACALLRREICVGKEPFLGSARYGLRERVIVEVEGAVADEVGEDKFGWRSVLGGLEVRSGGRHCENKVRRAKGERVEE